MQYFLTREKRAALRLGKLKSEKNQLQTRITDYIFSLPVKTGFLKYYEDNQKTGKKEQKKLAGVKALAALFLLEVFVILEHKSGFTPKVFKQMHRYFKLLQQELESKKTPYRIMGIVFAHGRRPWPAASEKIQERAGRLPHWLSEDFPATVEYNALLRSGDLIEVDTHSPAVQRIINSKKCKIGGVMLLFHHIWGLQDKGRDVRVEDIYERVARILEDKGPAVTILYVKEYLSSALWSLGEKRFNVLWEKVEQKLIKNNLLRKGGNMMTLDEELLLRGRQAGMQAGIEKGKLEGKLEGRLENQQQVIRNMLTEKVDLAFIAKVTGVSTREVKKFQNGRAGGKGRAKANGMAGNGRSTNGRSRNGT